MKKAVIRIEKDTIIVHTKGDRDDILFRTPILTHDYNGHQINVLPVHMLQNLEEHGYEVTVCVTMEYEKEA